MFVMWYIPHKPIHQALPRVQEDLVSKCTKTHWWPMALNVKHGYMMVKKKLTWMPI